MQCNKCGNLNPTVFCPNCEASETIEIAADVEATHIEVDVSRIANSVTYKITVCPGGPNVDITEVIKEILKHA